MMKRNARLHRKSPMHRVLLSISMLVMSMLLSFVAYAEGNLKQGVTSVYWKNSKSGIPKMAFIHKETGDMSFDLSKVPLMQKGKKFYNKITHVTYQGLLIPKYSGNYTFDTSRNKHVSLQINGQTVQTGNGQIVELQSGEPVRFHLQYNIQDDGKLFQVKWQQEGYKAEVIKGDFLKRIK